MKIIGHHEEQKNLEAILQRKNISQSYLFLGPESVGKQTVALGFACALVGEPHFEPSVDKPTPLDVRILEHAILL